MAKAKSKTKSKDKSIIEKFTQTMMGLADSAAKALKAEEPPKIGVVAAHDVPLHLPASLIAARAKASADDSVTITKA